MKSLSWLTREVLQDCGTRCGVPTSRDYLTIKRRTEDEGESFLTITLPDFCKDFESCLDRGEVSSTDFLGFKRSKKSGELPVFLQGFLTKVFGVDGHLLDEPDVDSIFCVRQICLALKKVLIPCSKERTRAAERKFIETDGATTFGCEFNADLWHFGCGDALRDTYVSVGRYLLGQLLRSVPYGEPAEGLHPRHGPGRNTDRVAGNSKWDFQSWYVRFERYLPFQEYGRGSLSDCQLSFDNFSILGGVFNGTSGVTEESSSGRAIRYARESIGPGVVVHSPEQEPPVKVVFVPKTLRTPRVIAVESLAMQYAQQAVREWLVTLVEKCELTSGRINFSDQTVNQKIASLASRDGSYATIDMSDASDRVSVDHVRSITSGTPYLWELLDATRTTRARLPSGVVLPLRKFASMGSATCFPVEAIVFFTAIVASRLHRAKMLPTPRNIRKYISGVFVYGDDLIVPASEAPSTCDDLESLGFKVNRRKTFWTGKFRESCGADCYDGADVTPVYVRRVFPASSSDSEGIVSWVATGNQFYLAGLWRVADAIRTRLLSVTTPFPLVPRNSSAVGWHTYQNACTISRWNPSLHRFEFRGKVVKPPRERDVLDGYPALLKCWSTIGSEVLPPADHLTVGVKRSSFALKARWVPSC